MLALLLAAALVCLACWLLSYWRATKRYWADRGVPSLPPHPILGSLTFLQQINTAIWMRQIYDHFQSPYVGAWWLWRPALVVNCPQIARNILVKDSVVFRNHYLSSASHDTIGSLNIFTTNDPLWSSVRRRLSPVFTSARLRSLQQLVTVKSKELVQRIALESKKGRFGLRSVINDYTTDVIGTASFGVKSDATLTGESPLRTVTKEFEKYSRMRGLAWSSIFFFPEFVSIFRFRMFPKNTTDYFRKIFSIVTEQRREEVRQSGEVRDLLDVLLKMKDNSIAEGEEMSDEILLAQATALIQGGFDTTGTVLSFIIYELAHNPEFQEKLYQEIKEAQEANEGSDFNENSMGSLTYLSCVIKETTRKYPPMGWLDRVSSTDYVIDDKLTIPAGMPVYVNAIGMQYDPQYFPDPSTFNPDRFLPENEGNIKKFTFLPFGEGPRGCIGQRFAMLSLRTALCAMLLHYEVRALPGTPRPSDVPLEKNSMFLMPAEPLYVDFVPRN